MMVRGVREALDINEGREVVGCQWGGLSQAGVWVTNAKEVEKPYHHHHSRITEIHAACVSRCGSLCNYCTYVYRLFLNQCSNRNTS